MFVKLTRRVRLLALMSTLCCPLEEMAFGQDTAPNVIKLVPKMEPAEFARPGVLPDRIVLTWSTDPATSQAVTWRTAVEVPRGVAQITVAEAGPIIETTSRQLVASTVPLKTEINTAHYHSVNFEGLSPEIKYAYRVGDGVNWSEWFHFTTASPESKPFSFIYFGDAQNDLRARWSRVIREAYSDAPKAKFMIHAGDLVNRAEADHEWQEWHEAGAWINGMMPTIAVPGNHEMAKIDETSRRLSRHWGPQFAFPENGPEGVKETCYTLVYQGVRIIGLNSNEMPHEQAEWLEKVLTDNKEKWVICTFHHPMFSTGEGRDNTELRALWKPILDKHRVDLVLQGHDHTYGRTGLDTPVGNAKTDGVLNSTDMFSGTVYVVSVSGPKMYNVRRHAFMSRHAEDTQLYQIISVNGDKLHFEAYTAVGELYDAFTLTKQNGAANTLKEEIPDTPERLRPPVVKEPAKKASAALK